VGLSPQTLLSGRGDRRFHLRAGSGGVLADAHPHQQQEGRGQGKQASTDELDRVFHGRKLAAAIFMFIWRLARMEVVGYIQDVQRLFISVLSANS